MRAKAKFLFLLLPIRTLDQKWQKAAGESALLGSTRDNSLDSTLDKRKQMWDQWGPPLTSCMSGPSSQHPHLLWGWKTC